MSESHFDLIVIGTGPAASTIAKKMADDGKRVATVESRQFGGKGSDGMQFALSS